MCNDSISCGEREFQFRKRFKNHSFFLGTITEVFNNIDFKNNLWCTYNVSDIEVVSFKQILPRHRMYHLPPCYPPHTIDEEFLTNQNSNGTILKNCTRSVSQDAYNLRRKSQSINLNTVIELMTLRKIDLYCTQVTWFDYNFVKKINNYINFYHRLKKQICKRGQRCVAIIFFPLFMIFHGKKWFSSFNISRRLWFSSFRSFQRSQTKFKFEMSIERLLLKQKNETSVTHNIHIYNVPFCNIWYVLC